MKKRVSIASLVLTLGVSIYILIGVWIVSHYSIPAHRRPQFPWHVSVNLALIGGVLVVVGISTTGIVYLTRRWGFQHTYPQAFIIALFRTNQQGEMVLYPEGYAPHSLRYYVRLTLPNGESDEFECSLALFQQLREGMRGRAVCKGNQLLAFYPDAYRMSG